MNKVYQKNFTSSNSTLNQSHSFAGIDFGFRSVEFGSGHFRRSRNTRFKLKFHLISFTFSCYCRHFILFQKRKEAITILHPTMVPATTMVSITTTVQATTAVQAITTVATMAIMVRPTSLQLTNIVSSLRNELCC